VTSKDGTLKTKNFSVGGMCHSIIIVCPIMSPLEETRHFIAANYMTRMISLEKFNKETS
jgi:hypothetical protein